MDDRELVTAAQHGDRRALEALLRQQYDLVHAVCRRITANASDADDATQEAMLGIVRGLPRFDGRSSVSTWVYRIATNAALDELRRRRRRPQLHVVDDEGPRHEEVDPVAHRRVEAVVDRLAVEAALDRLADDFRTAVVLRDVADLDYAEIAEALDVPVGTVKSRIARGRAQLVEILGNRVDPDGRPMPTSPGRAPAPPTGAPTPPAVPPTPPPASSTP